MSTLIQFSHSFAKEFAPYDPTDSWVCVDGQGPWVKDYNGDGNSYTSNNNGVSSAGGSGSDLGSSVKLR